MAICRSIVLFLLLFLHATAIKAAPAVVACGDRPVTPADLHATVFTALGYDPHGILYHTVDGRPTPLSEGEPIAELLG